MGVMTTASFAKALWPGVNKWYGDAYKEYKQEWPDLFKVDSSSQAYEEDVGSSGFGLAVVKTEGAGIHYDSAKQGFTTRYTHVTYALGFIVTREAFEDNLYSTVAKRKAQALAFSMRQTKEIVAANVLNRAFSTSYTGGDGASLVASAGGGGSASHSNVAGGTWTNGPSAAVDLSEAALEQAHIDIAGFTDDRGLKIAVRPTALIIPQALVFEAHRILDSNMRPFTSDNDANALKDMGIVPKKVVNHYLTDTDAWFLLTDAPEGLKMFNRRAEEFGADNDFDTENAKFKASMRFSVGWTDPRGVYGSPGV